MRTREHLGYWPAWRVTGHYSALYMLIPLGLGRWLRALNRRDGDQPTDS